MPRPNSLRPLVATFALLGALALLPACDSDAPGAASGYDLVQLTDGSGEGAGRDGLGDGRATDGGRGDGLGGDGNDGGARDGASELPVDRQDGLVDLPVDRGDAREGGAGDGGDGGAGDSSVDTVARDSSVDTVARDSSVDSSSDVGPSPVRITSVSPMTSGLASAPYSFQFLASGGLGPSSYVWSVNAPWGSINAGSGLFSGTAPAAAPQTYAVTVTVTSGAQNDTQTFQLPIVGTLGPVAQAQPFFEHTGAPGALDLTTLVAGGSAPFSCNFFSGAGQGTRPTQMVPSPADPTGCTLSGGFAPSDAPGVYGFIVTVSDSNGQSTEVLIVVRNGSCNTSAVTMTPPEYPVRQQSPGSTYGWTVVAGDVDPVCTNPTCTSCRVCLNRQMGTLSPLSTASQLDCANPGDLCSASGSFSPVVCQTQGSFTGTVNYKAHTPLRSGAPAWVTTDYSMTYSGTVASNSACGNKQWTCHWETLER